jgi:hypothetical protein
MSGRGPHLSDHLTRLISEVRTGSGSDRVSMLGKVYAPEVETRSLPLLTFSGSKEMRNR